MTITELKHCNLPICHRWIFSCLRTLFQQIRSWNPYILLFHQTCTNEQSLLINGRGLNRLRYCYDQGPVSQKFRKGFVPENFFQMRFLFAQPFYSCKVFIILAFGIVKRISGNEHCARKIVLGPKCFQAGEKRIPTKRRRRKNAGIF